MRLTLGLLLCWLTNKFSSFCSLSAAVPADVILFGFLLLISSSYFQSAAVPGWTFNKYQHSSKPCPLWAIGGHTLKVVEKRINPF
jgi:hypothetical protein